MDREMDRLKALARARGNDPKLRAEELGRGYSAPILEAKG